ncbi:hypothetical protein [Microbulbifer rhizosphaerae]|uniref:DUF4145 domain-containing protein n=1 Tax=Microbulbifer rhizosphaerae TaxID=1562603 RepID=A0A7W4Z823_9GAMM|nr:hypothetical protein [Microbulbifer rhizosphaerae]MBB3060101.1 hypothetical protein [Microbulbifer rhizosphaerae]
MKVATFRLEDPERIPQNDIFDGGSETIFKIPTLPAYAIHHSNIEMDPCIFTASEVTQKISHEIQNCMVTVRGYYDLYSPASGFLTIYHAGIKDYSLLFPHIKSESLRQRLGQFAQEAESALSSQSWMSYVLMVGAVLEGLLFNQFGDKSFAVLIRDAIDRNLIDNQEAALFQEVRATRNRVHAAKHMEPFSNRKIAMELNVIYERLLKRSWISPD